MSQKKYYYLHKSGVIAIDSELTKQCGFNIGETYADIKDGKFAAMSLGQVGFWETNPSAQVKEIWDCELTPEPPPYVQTLEEVKLQKIADLMAYDASNAVNGFYITRDGNTFELWLKPEERASLSILLNGARKVGLTELSLSFGGLQITETIDNMELMQFVIEKYAYEAVVHRDGVHRAAIESCQTIQEVDNYDFTTGWPLKPEL